jgi:hypothetical protein
MDYKTYEQRKQAIRELNLTPAEYEKEIQKLTKELENDTSTKSI